jgi:hypothetical protein
MKWERQGKAKSWASSLEMWSLAFGILGREVADNTTGPLRRKESNRSDSIQGESLHQGWVHLKIDLGSSSMDTAPSMRCDVNSGAIRGHHCPHFPPSAVHELQGGFWASTSQRDRDGSFFTDVCSLSKSPGYHLVNCCCKAVNGTLVASQTDCILKSV